MSVDSWSYPELKAMLGDVELPAMIVDLDVLERNAERIRSVSEQHGKKLRIASKSVRVPDLLKLLMDFGAPTFQGLMCYSAAEAEFLASRGFDDLLVAYPTVQDADLQRFATLIANGTRVTAMIDCARHVQVIDAFWTALPAAPPLRVCVDVDMSLRIGGQHVGVQRSPVRSSEEFERVMDAAIASPSTEFVGVMGYEAQVAGLGDASPFAPHLNSIKRMLKRRSVKDIAEKRRRVFDAMKSRGVTPEIYNGGGSGSLDTTTQEPWLTEVTAGSGFLQSHLFDYYGNNRNEAAFAFALQVTRSSEAGFVTCQSGGFVASGEPGVDKVPVPFRPAGLKLTKSEAAGEVQTPLRSAASAYPIQIGDPVLFRSSKAGEIAERFSQYVLKRGYDIVGRADTYRGLGLTFF